MFWKKLFFWVFIFVPLFLMTFSVKYMSVLFPSFYGTSKHLFVMPNKSYFLMILITYFILIFGLSYFASKINNTIFQTKKLVETIQLIIALIFNILTFSFLYLGTNALDLFDNNKTDISLYLVSFFGITMVIYGIILPFLTQNSPLSFNNFWTIKNDVVWSKTNKLATLVFVLIGSVSIVSAIINTLIGLIVLLSLFALGIISITSFSYHLYKKESKIFFED